MSHIITVIHACTMTILHYTLRVILFVVYDILFVHELLFLVMTYHAGGAPYVGRCAVACSHQRFRTSILARLNIVREVSVLQRQTTAVCTLSHVNSQHCSNCWQKL